jgi:hypothetical protein
MPSSILNSDDGVISGTSGLKSSGGDDGVLVFQSKGTETARINTDKQIVAAAGTASLPALTTTGDVNTGIFFPAADTIAFAEGGAEAMRIDSSGNVGIGTSSPASSTTRLTVYDNTNGGILFLGRDAGEQRGQLVFGRLNSGSQQIVARIVGNSDNASGNNGILTFSTANSSATITERMRITSGGYFKASNNGTYVDSGGSYHEFNQSSATAQGMIVWCSSNSYDSNVLLLRSARNTTNASYFYLRCFNTTSETNKLLIADSGNVTNTNNSYGSISDVKLKQDIVDAGSQWDDIKNLRVRKYRWKSEPDGFMQLGLVAQEAELVSPGLVEEHQDRDEENNFTGETTKAVKYSVLYMKAVKALQEAMERIETLEGKNDALEARIAALEQA